MNKQRTEMRQINVATDGPVKPFVVRAGGKRRLLPRLLPLIPASARCVVEAFGGGGALTLGRQRVPGQLEVINDIDGELVNAWRQVRDHGPEVIRCLEGRVNSRRDFVAWRDADLASLTEVQRAARYFFLNRLSFGGDNGSFGVRRTAGGGAANHLARGAELIAAAHGRLQGVIVESLPWQRLVRCYDAPGTWWFIDPPYLGGGQNHYDTWTVAEWEELAATLRTLAGGWVVTSGDHAAIRDLFGGWSVVETWDRANGIGAGKRGEAGKRLRELVIRPRGQD